MSRLFAKTTENAIYVFMNSLTSVSSRTVRGWRAD